MKKILIGLGFIFSLFLCVSTLADDDIPIIDIMPIDESIIYKKPEPKPAEEKKFFAPKKYQGTEYYGDDSDMHTLSRAIWSVTPRRPTDITKIAFCEVVQNRVDDTSAKYENTIRGVLNQKGEFKDFDPKAHRSNTNDELASYAMRTWKLKQQGDDSYRYVPSDGVKCDFYEKGNFSYIKVYNSDNVVVFDSGSLEFKK